MRIISLSVDGIHQAASRGLYDWIAKQDADIVCLQDLRALEPELDHPFFIRKATSVISSIPASSTTTASPSTPAMHLKR